MAYDHGNAAEDFDIDQEEEDATQKEFVPLKEQVVIVIDAQPGMFQLPEDQASVPEGLQGRSAFNVAVKLTARLCKQRIIASASDEIAVVFYGTGKAQNSRNWEGVYVLHDLDVPDAQRIQDLQDMSDHKFQEAIGSSPDADKAPDRRAADLHHVLWAASNLFSSHSSKASKRILLLTSDPDPVAASGQPGSFRQQIETRVEGLKALKVVLQLFPLAALFHEGLSLSPFWQGITEELADPDEMFDVMDVISRVADLEAQVKKKSFHKRPSGRTSINIGELKIGVELFALVRPATKASSVLLERASNKPLARESAYICRDTGAILPSDEALRKRRFKLGSGDTGRFPEVIFTSEELKSIKAVKEPGLHVLGFKPLSCLQPHHQLANGDFVYPSERQLKGSCAAFMALHAVMLGKQQMAVACYVRTQASMPRLVALVAQEQVLDECDTQLMPEGLLLLPLPFSDDLRYPEAGAKVLPPIANSEQATQQLQAAEALVEALTVDDSWDSSMCNDPVIARHFEVLEAVALDQSVPPLESFQEDVMQYMAAGQVEGAGELLGGLRDALGLAEPPAGTAKAGSKRAKPEDATRNIATYVASQNWKDLAQGGWLAKLTVADLDMYLEYHRLKKTGNKGSKVDRIKEHLGL